MVYVGLLFTGGQFTRGLFTGVYSPQSCPWVGLGRVGSVSWWVGYWVGSGHTKWTHGQLWFIPAGEWPEMMSRSMFALSPQQLQHFLSLMPSGAKLTYINITGKAFPTEYAIVDFSIHNGPKQWNIILYVERLQQSCFYRCRSPRKGLVKTKY